MKYTGILTGIDIKTKGEVFKDKLKFGEPFERVLLLQFVVVDGDGKSIDQHTEIINLTYSHKGKLGKFLSFYGEPVKGMQVLLKRTDKGWSVCFPSDD